MRTPVKLTTTGVNVTAAGVRYITKSSAVRGTSIGWSALLDEAAIAAEKNFKSGYNSQRCPIPGTIKQREVYHELSRSDSI